VAKAKKKNTPKYTDEAMRNLAALSEHFSLPHRLLKGFSQPSRPVVSSAPVTTTDDFFGSARDWIVAEARRMKAGGEIHEGIIKTHFAKKLATSMDKAAEASKASWSLDDKAATVKVARTGRPTPRAVGHRYIRHKLPAWGLWPISSIK
jgi:hypothetical protein